MQAMREEEKKQLLAEITQFFAEEYDLELGIIGSERIYEFFEKAMGERIYNQALDDAQRFFRTYANNMEADYYALYKEIH